MRRIFSTVFGPQDPALTVGSLAMSATRRPPIVAMPVTTPSAPRPSCSQLASSALLGEGVGVDQPLDPLADRELALLGGLLVVALRAAGEGGLEGLGEVGHGRSLFAWLACQPTAGSSCPTHRRCERG